MAAEVVIHQRKRIFDGSHHRHRQRMLHSLLDPAIPLHHRRVLSLILLELRTQCLRINLAVDDIRHGCGRRCEIHPVELHQLGDRITYGDRRRCEFRINVASVERIEHIADTRELL